MLLGEANYGSLQRFLDEHHEIDDNTRRRWFRQATESITYIHGRGVIHSDLRPDNFLVHGTWPQLDLWLCDFGGSSCHELGLSGGSLPDAGFFNPDSDLTPSVSLDIFSLGSILYTILTGHWPFCESGAHISTSMDDYEIYVESLFQKHIFPDVSHLWGGQIILGCWTGRFSAMEEIVVGVKAL